MEGWGDSQTTSSHSECTRVITLYRTNIPGQLDGGTSVVILKTGVLGVVQMDSALLLIPDYSEFIQDFSEGVHDLPHSWITNHVTKLAGKQLR